MLPRSSGRAVVLNDQYQVRRNLISGVSFAIKFTVTCREYCLIGQLPNQEYMYIYITSDTAKVVRKNNLAETSNMN